MRFQVAWRARVEQVTLNAQVMYGPVFESDFALGWERLTAELVGASARQAGRPG